jgi:hypothetical protein
MEKVRQKQQAAGIQVAMEPTNYFWRLLAQELEGQEMPYHLVNAYTVKKHREWNQLDRSNDDPRDAGQIAELSRTGHYTETRLQKGCYEELGQYATLYHQTLQAIQREEQVIWGLAGQAFPELIQVFKDLQGETCRALLLRCACIVYPHRHPGQFTHIVTPVRFGGMLAGKTSKGKAAMEEQWLADRNGLRAVWLEHPAWSKRQLAEAIGHSKSWVKKWMRRIRSHPLEDQEVLLGRSHARKRAPPQTAPEVVDRILAIRDDPPPKLGRTPGPVTILYYLQRDAMLAELGYRLPRSTRTIWKILDRNHRILRPGPRKQEAREPVEPGVEWGMDFHDVSTVPADPGGKQQHVVEILNFVDHTGTARQCRCGSSAVVASEPSDAYTAETALPLRSASGTIVADGRRSLAGARLPGPH